MQARLKWDQIVEAVKKAYAFAKDVQGGENAHYIPYLAGVDKNLFGIAVTAKDGRTFSLGDTDYRFGIESVSKVPTAILALRQEGAENLLKKIGADATGLPFNSIFAILLENDHPSTPLVNAGAIAACSLIEPAGNAKGKWEAIQKNMSDLMGSSPVLIDELYRSESETNFQNRSIAWLLKDYDRLYDDPMMSLDLYTRQCSLGVTASQLACMAATICSGGVNPVTKKEVFDGALAPKIVSLMATVGFYQHSGDWIYETGLPAKTGVGGAVMGVMPGLFGICAFSPPLDSAGNSIRAQAALKKVMEELDLHIFSGRYEDLD